MKRDDNLKQKENGVKKLMDEAAKIQEAREQRRMDNEAKREQKVKEKEEYEIRLKAAKDKGLVEVYEKINKKKKDKKAEEDRQCQWDENIAGEIEGRHDDANR